MAIVHHLTLTVRDADASASWYQALLGEAECVERTGPDWRRVRMRWPDGLVIGVTQYEEGDRAVTFSHLRPGLDHVGLSCASESEVREWAKRIDRLGVTRGPVEEAPYGWAVTARDPDDIPVEFFCPS